MKKIILHSSVQVPFNWEKMETEERVYRHSPAIPTITVYSCLGAIARLNLGSCDPILPYY